MHFHDPDGGMHYANAVLPTFESNVFSWEMKLENPSMSRT